MAADLERIEEIFHVAMTVNPDRRDAYLDTACDENPALRQEVESLVAAYESGSSLLDDSAVTLALKVLGAKLEDDIVGRELGAYRVLRALGHGGMGSVYLAEDTLLDRKVALKCLSGDFVMDNWGKRQLIKEAQAVARLDHPNICAVYGFEEIGDHSFIVMQYIEGQTIAELVSSKAIAIEQVIPLAHQIVSALAAAHAHGIIHRDIKPKNIMVTPAGQVKVLDFGLAKMVHKTLEEADSISRLSGEGLLVGTVAYMSPEQLRADKLDYRTDIFSLGTVLYEMVSGSNPFSCKADAKTSRSSNAEVISAIMSDEPKPLRQTAVNCPRDFDRLVAKCLRKNRAERYQSAAELLIDLDNLQKGVGLAPRLGSILNIRVAATTVMVLLTLFVAIFIYKALGTSAQTLVVLPITCDEATIKSGCIGPELTDELIKSLSTRGGLRVVSRLNGPSLFGTQATSAPDIARDMGADVIMSGRISRGESGMTLTLRVVRKDGAKLFEEPEPLTADNLPMTAQWISLKAASQLQIPANESDRTLLNALAAKQNLSGDAVQLYLLGRRRWLNRDGTNIQAAIDDFRAAIEKDPSFAQAYAGLADSYILTNTAAYASLANKDDAMVKAEWAAKQALKFGDNRAEAHNAYASVLMKAHWDWENAEKEFKRAIAIDHDYSSAHWGYSNLLAITGRFGEALGESQMAKESDPLSAPTIMNHCRVLYFARQFDQSLACFDRLLQEYPEYTAGKSVRGALLIQQGKIDEAITLYGDIYNRDKLRGAAMLGYCYGLANRQADAEKIIGELHELEKQSYVSPQEFAIIYLGLNDLTDAAPLFRQAIEQKFPPAQTIFIDPLFDRLRADPAFASLAREVRLPARAADASAPSTLSSATK